MTRLELPLEDEMARQLNDAGLTRYDRQFRFLPPRRFKADFAFQQHKLIVEVDGGQWKFNTGHNNGQGKERDCIRDAEAAIAGWTTLRFTTNLVRSGEAVKYIRRFIEHDRQHL